MARTVAVGQEALGGGEWKPIPAGTKVNASVFAIEEVQVKSGDNAGKPQLDVTFKVQGGQYNGTEIRYQKIPLYDGPAAWKLVTFGKAVGLDVTADGNVQLLEANEWSKLLGKQLQIKVSVRADNNGVDRNQVSGYAPLDTPGDIGAETTAPSWSSLNK